MEYAELSDNPLTEGNKFLLWAVNLVCLVVHFSMAVVVLIRGAEIGDRMYVQLTTSAAVWTGGTSGTVFDQVIVGSVLSLRLDYLSAAFALVSAAAHLFVVSCSKFSIGEKHKKFNNWIYYDNLRNCLVWWRWVEYSISAPIMMIAMALTAGVYDVNVLGLLFFLQMCTMYFGWLTEWGARPAKQSWEIKSVWSRLLPFFFGVVPYTAAWVVFIAQFNRNVYENEKRNTSDRTMPSYVYAIVYSEVVIFSLFAIPLVVYQKKSPQHYWQSELWYSFLSLTSKTVLNGILLSSVFIVG